MVVTVSGASGFVGKQLIQYLLLNTDHRIIAYTSKPAKIEERFSGFATRLDIFADRDNIPWSTVDVLVNLAYPRNNTGSNMARGLKFVFDLISDAVHGGVKSIINISSQSVYSPHRICPADEQSDLDLESMYAVGKYTTELYLNAICSAPHTNIRLASLIGAGFEQRITNKFVNKAIKNEMIYLTGGTQRFGFLDIRDAVSGIAAVIESDHSLWEEHYNLGTNRFYTLEEIAECVLEESKNYCSNPAKYSLEKSDQFTNSSLNCSKFMQTFLWYPEFGLADTIKWIFEEKCFESRG